jgi:hypothetical protein
MAEIHPTFDPSEGRWFTDGGASAPTIRELLKKLPPGTEVRDYYPDGREVFAAERGFVVHDMRRAAEVRPKLDHAPRACVIQPTRKKLEREPVRAPASSDRRRYNGFHRRSSGTYDRDRILDLHMNGCSPREIAAALGPEAKLATVASTIQVARQRGDGRAWRAGDPRRAANRLARISA